MMLSELLLGLVDSPVPTGEIRALVDDSRQAGPGSLFFARCGAHADGVRYVEPALRAGALAALVPTHAREQLPAALQDDARVLWVPDLPAVMAAVANRFHGDPVSALRIVGVTGTNGKTSVARFVATALSEVAGPVGTIGTLGVSLMRPGGETKLFETANTTPGSLALMAALAALREAGARYVVMEVSSHAMVQRRLEGIPVEVAVFTNLSRDHLDYHGDLDAYYEAKALLFAHPGLREAVINMDDAHGRRLLERFGDRVSCWAFGLGDVPWEAGDAQLIRAESVVPGRQGMTLSLRTGLGRGQLSSALYGSFNASNLLAALGALLALGMPKGDALAALGRVQAPPGRMQHIPLGVGGPRVVVDYAHTPDALEQVLKALRAHVDGRLLCVFGCGGERDAGKRPAMGEVTERHADIVLLTDDNPRGEPGEQIIAQILAGMSAPDAVLIERDRRTAIHRALDMAGPSDLVLIAGKGHEDYQEVAGKRLPFSDEAVVLDWEGEKAA